MIVRLALAVALALSGLLPTAVAPAPRAQTAGAADAVVAPAAATRGSVRPGRR